MQDALRYTLTANAPETKDNDFTWKDFQAKNNNELVAIFGNFINRVVVLTHKYYDGIVPAPAKFSQLDLDTLAEVKKFPEKISSSIERYRFREASQELMNLARLGNKYLADEEPWKVIKEDEERVRTIMFVALQIATGLAALSEPFLPFTSLKLKSMLNVTSSAVEMQWSNVSQKETLLPNHQNAETERSRSLSWSDVSQKETLLPQNHQINKAELLFRKVEDSEIQAQLDKLEATKKANASTALSTGSTNNEIMPQKETITFDDFTKLDMRVGTIIEAEKWPRPKNCSF
jgi:methionyl-tRNA synthetase